MSQETGHRQDATPNSRRWDGEEKVMHIEPGLVADSKIWLSYVTAAGAGAVTLKLAIDTIRERGTARHWVVIAGLGVWAALALASAVIALPALTLVPLLVLVASFEVIFTLHTGVEAKDPFPPPPPPPPPPAPPKLRDDVSAAIEQVKASIEKINTVPVTDKGDASTKDARIAAYNLNMDAQKYLERQFLREDQPADVVSQLRTADAKLEDANWQLAKKPSPDGRFTGVDIPGAMRDSNAAVDILTKLLETAPAA